MWHLWEGLCAPLWLLLACLAAVEGTAAGSVMGRQRFTRGFLHLSHCCLSVLCLCCAVFTLLFTRAKISRADLSPELCLR